MATQQQQETHGYFNAFAASWKQKADGAVVKVNVIRQRNDYVLRVARSRAHTAHALDVGCGTGELVRDLARLGIAATGVDFAAEMIAIARDGAAREGVSGAHFVHASIFDHPADGTIDLVSANGFIEYISYDELVAFLRHVRRLLAPGGSLVLGSRNRLYNAFSLNAFTEIELSNGALPTLVAEATAIAEAETVAEAIARLSAPMPALPVIAQHPNTGVGVTTRHQYTPGHLVRLLREAGLDTVGMAPIHYHVAPPRFAKAHPSVHIPSADLMQEHADELHYLVPYASSFMLHAVAGGDA